MINESLAKKIMNDLKDDYDKTARLFAISRDRMWSELKFLFDYAKKDDRVLDVGCGNGRFSKYLENTDYTGVDFSENLIKEAKERFPDKRFFVANALSLPFQDNSFDKVYCIAVVHQIPKEEYRIKALEEIKRVLKKGGLAFVTVWDVKKSKSFSYLLDDKKQKDANIFNIIIAYFKKLRKPRDFFLKRKRYYYIFKKGELSCLAKKAGLKVIKEGVVKERKRSNFYIILARPS